MVSCRSGAGLVAASGYLRVGVAVSVTVYCYFDSACVSASEVGHHHFLFCADAAVSLTLVALAAGDVTCYIAIFSSGCSTRFGSTCKTPGFDFTFCKPWVPFCVTVSCLL